MELSWLESEFNILFISPPNCGEINLAASQVIAAMNTSYKNLFMLLGNSYVYSEHCRYRLKAIKN